ncbi:cupin domain-containing protein [Bacillus pakistanensis]|uniref:cupin domain-containing protein n=1 Tax=Rossellomorea pakistanensis TaxID=992288 RepID=UPI001965B98D
MVKNQTNTLKHPDGRTVTFLETGVDEKGDYLLVEHRIWKQGAMNGPHWHPVLTESFTINKGKMKFLVDGKESIVSKGETISIHPQEIHQFWNISENGLVAIHEIRPPGQHRKMFELIHKLESEGKLNKKGIPSNPFWLGMVWASMDGYIKGPPKFVQVVLFGGLASLGKWFGLRV